MTEQPINFAEPTLEQLAALRKAAGDEQATIHFTRESGGVRVALRTSEKPPREWSTQLVPGLDDSQRNATWEEFISRVRVGAGGPATGNEYSSQRITDTEGNVLKDRYPNEAIASGADSAEPVNATPQNDEPTNAREGDRDAAPSQRDPEETDAELEGPHK